MIDGLAYVVVRTNDLEAWTEMAVSQVGMQATVLEAGKSVHLRLDEKAQRLVVLAEHTKPSLTMGFSVAGEPELTQLEQALSDAGVAWQPSTQTERQLRQVQGLIYFQDPDGNPLEAAYGLQNADSPFQGGRPTGGFRTGDLGMGHVALKAGKYEEMLAFYRGVLQFRLSDRATKPFKVEFLHVNPRHHTIGIADAGTGPGIYHLMVEYRDFDDIGRSYDLALAQPEQIGVSLGRHINDHVTSFYLKTPDGWMLELGWAGRVIGPDWQVEELPGLSLWGHDRTWLPDNLREDARQILKELSARGVRAPLALPPELPQKDSNKESL